MPTESELTDQIETYGRWLEGDLATDLACPTNDPAAMAASSDASLLAEPELIDVDVVSAPKRQRTSVLAFAAAAVIALVGIGLLVQRPNGSGVVEPVVEPADTTTPPATPAIPSTSPPEPSRTGVTRPEASDTPAPLFVLPESLDGFSIVDGPSADLPSGDTGSGIVVGREVATGFNDVGAVLFVEELSFTGNEEEVEIDGLVVLIADYGAIDPSTSIGVEVPEGGWLEVSAATQEQAVALARAASVDQGTLVFAPFDGIEVIDRIERLEAGRSTFLSLRDEQESRFVTIIVRSGFNQIGLVGLPGDLERISVRGGEGFRTRTVTPFGDESSAVSWLEEPGQLVVVLAGGPIDAVEVAEGLRTVDEETWFAELETLPVFDPLESAVGYPIGTFVFLDEQGDEVQFAANGEPTIVVPGASTCEDCFTDLDAIAALTEADHPETRVLVLRLDPESGWAGPQTWTGPVYSLPESGVDLGPFNIADSITDGELLLLDGDNQTVARIDVAQPDAIERLGVLLDLLD